MIAVVFLVAAGADVAKEFAPRCDGLLVAAGVVDAVRFDLVPAAAAAARDDISTADVAIVAVVGGTIPVDLFPASTAAIGDDTIAVEVVVVFGSIADLFVSVIVVVVSVDCVGSFAVLFGSIVPSISDCAVAANFKFFSVVSFAAVPLLPLLPAMIGPRVLMS